MAKIAHYAMENNWNDEGGLYNGTPVGVLSFSGDAAVGSYSGSFDGSGSYVDIGNSSNLIPSNMSITGWVKIDSAGSGDRAILARWDTVGGIDQRCFILQVDSSSKLVFRITGYGWSEGDAFISSDSITPDVWTFFSVTWDGSEIKGYINAVENGTPVSHTGISASTNITGIGAIPGRGGSSGDSVIYRFDGLLDDIRIYDEALTQNQIADIYGLLSQYTATYNAGVNGSITGDAVQTVYEGFESTEVTATPDIGYFFDQWDDGVLTASRTDIITADLTVEAQFTDTTILTYTAGINGTLTGDTSQSVGYGEDGTEVIAVPDSGFIFLEWSDGVLTASRTDLNITEALDVTAYFGYPEGINANFSGSPITGPKPLHVQFTDTTVVVGGASALKKTWYFGDGQSYEEGYHGILPGPLHSYLVPGIYSPRLDIVSEWTDVEIGLSAHHTSRIRYLNGLYISAIYFDHFILSSHDGVNWTSYELTDSMSGGWSGVAYGNGVYVVCTVWNYTLSQYSVLTSPDGITWSQWSMGGTQNVTDMVFANGLFVAVGDSSWGAIAVTTSSDGITWTTRTPSIAGKRWAAIAYGVGLFVAVSNDFPPVNGGNTACMTSPDGITWTTRTLPVDQYCIGIAFGNSTFVSIGNIYIGGAYDDNHSILTSPDGINWTVRTNPNGGIAQPSRITFDGASFILYTYTSGSWNELWTSSDGITWALLITSAPPNIESIASSGSEIVLGGGGTYYYDNHVTDSITRTDYINVLDASLNKLAFISSWESDCLEIVNIADPTNLLHVSRFNNGESGATVSTPKCVVAEGDYVYIGGAGTPSHYITIIDVSNPVIPVFVRTIFSGDDGITLYYPQCMKIVNNFLYILNSPSLEILDISDPINPTHVSFISTGASGGGLQSCRRFFILNNYVYITDYNGYALEIIDISNIGAPLNVGNAVNGIDGVTLDRPWGIYVENDYAYVGSYYFTPGLEILDVSDPTNPTHVTFIENGANGATLYGIYDIKKLDSYLYIINYDNLEIMDISNPVNPTHVGNTATLSGLLDLEIVDPYVYLPVYGSDAFQALDITDRINPISVDTLLNNESGAGLREPTDAFISLSDIGPVIINSIVPDRGSVQGGTIVTITGSGFGDSQGTGSVEIGEKRLEILSWSNTQIRAITSSNEPGTYDVLVYNDSGLIGVF